MDPKFLDAKWIWHPQWSETKTGTAGGFVHFRKSIEMADKPSSPVNIQISADTRYKLFVNSELIAFGPVKGDQHMWFFDEVDIGPYLRPGLNTIAVRVLRFYHATSFATSFPRLHSPGLVIRHDTTSGAESSVNVATDETWETALDDTTYLPVDIAEDDFLHIYEDVDSSKSHELSWVSAKVLEFPTSYGATAPWKLSPRLIPYPRLTPSCFKTLHNVKSTVPTADLERTLLSCNGTGDQGILLKAGSSHHIELEADHHVTAFLSFRFDRPANSGAVLRIKYSECYEDNPTFVPYVRKKGNRLDPTKKLFGPQDVYRFGGKLNSEASKMPNCDSKNQLEETFSPFHFRTFRIITVDIEVAQESDLTWHGIDMKLQNYPLDVVASFATTDIEHAKLYDAMWLASILTLRNCLHDTYEDCPMYEQLQYPMDTRSSILFTYCVANDDRLARQAMIQLNNTYQPSTGLTASRAPAHNPQTVPPFSLYWICMVADHYWYYGDLDFVRQFCHTCDGVLESFARRIDPDTGLVRHDPDSPQWDFVDSTYEWGLSGVPPAGKRTGFISYTNMLYAYTLETASKFVRAVGKPELADKYTKRAQSLITSLKTHCFDGQLFTDGLANNPDPRLDYSQQTQIWAVLSGAASGDLASSILEQTLCPKTADPDLTAEMSKKFTRASTAMSFYALRALSQSKSELYDRTFHQFWEPWRTQLSKNLSTWEEDALSQRSDCHAWACAPLYEFTMEVAGLQPAAPGWSEISFRPRLGLFKNFAADVPYGGTRNPGVAHIEWRTIEKDENEKTVIELSLQLRPKQKQTTQDQIHGQIKVDIQMPNSNTQQVEDSQGDQNGRVLKWTVTPN